MEEFGTPLFDLGTLNQEMFPKDLVGNKDGKLQQLIQKHQILPLYKRGNRLFISMTDPTNLNAQDEVKFATGCTVDAVLVEQHKLDDFIDKLDKILGGGSIEVDEGDMDLENIDISSVDEAGGAGGDDGGEVADEAPIVKFINKLLLDAIKGGSSDLHFEPYEKAYRVRFRTDGILHEVSRPPVNLSGRLAARLKVMSKMDISERRIPQDGRIKMKVS